MPIAASTPKEASFTRRTLILWLRVHLHVLGEVAGLVEHFTAYLAREAALGGGVRTRVGHEMCKVYECSATLDTAQTDTAARLVLRLVPQTPLA